MKRFLAFSLIVFCCLSVFGQQKSTPKTKESIPKTPLSTPVGSEEYLVYVVVLGGGQKFVVQEKTAIDNLGSDENKGFLLKAFKELKPETISDFETRNKQSARLEKKFPSKADFTLITREELDGIFRKGLNWDKFYKMYPNTGGFYTVSRVGFSKDSTQALVFVAHSCGGLCGEGNYFFLQQTDGVWKVVKKQMTWVS